MKPLQGIYPALLTPFTKENKINEKALCSLIELNLQKGVDGFYVGGSTAEAFLLSQEERKYILDVVMDACGGRCTVIYHVGSISQDEAITLAKHGEKHGVDAISSIPPFYYSFTFDEIRDYYFGIVDAVDVPMLIYNFPKFSGVTLDEQNIRCFLEDDRFLGVKHTSNDFFALERFKKMYPDCCVFNGFDEMFAAGLAMGADGGIGSTYNFMAEKFIRIRSHFLAGETEAARQEQQIVNDIIKILISGGVLQSEKAVLTLMGLDFGTCRRPFKPLTDEQISCLRETVLPLLDAVR